MNLTDEEIRIKVAEACGWHEEKEPIGSANASAWWHNNDRYPSYLMPVPNYPESLDACAEFEKTLSNTEFRRYRRHLNKLCNPSNGSIPPTREIICATARQRCIAYLRAKGILP